MITKNNSNNNDFKKVFILTIIFISTFSVFLFSIEFWDNYKVINHKNEFIKIKVKIDSIEFSTTTNGTSSPASKSLRFYFNKGNFLKIQQKRNFLLSCKNQTEDIKSFMSNHSDSINLWYFNKKMIKYSYENEKEINVFEEIENNKKIMIYFAIYIVFVILIIKFKSKIS